jgi:hypothetical protein
MNVGNEIELLLRSRFTLIVIVTLEEERVVKILKDLAERKERPLYTWDIADGFKAVTDKNTPIQHGATELEALAQIAKSPDGAVYLLKDFHESWGDKKIKRKLRTLAQDLIYTKTSIIVTTPSNQIPEELKDKAVIIEMPLPDTATLAESLDLLLKHPGLKKEISADERDRFLQAALGLTTSQAQRVFTKALVRDGSRREDDINLVTEEKRALIRESQALEYHPVSESLLSVGGLVVLKEWLSSRTKAFSSAAQDYGLPSPKGIALIGIPGTGKSLAAKMIGNMWKLPLLQLDVGSLFGSYIGESEERARKAFRLVETVAPCILWLDEMEKALSHGGNDSGTSTRVFGTILTWMSERRAPVFVAATANDISSLPPELLRRGRFDEIFFLDLPNKSERIEIFSVHLRKRKRDALKFDLGLLAEATEGFVGAEIEQSIIDALYFSFNAHREVTTEDILVACKRTIPLSVSQEERIDYLRSWLTEGRAISASVTEKTAADQ